MKRVILVELQGKVAFVTGGGRGIGRETCILLAKHGAKVAVFSRSQTEVAETANYIIDELGGEAISVTGDACLEEDVKRAIQETRYMLGSIDILVNNAGTMLLKPFDETTIEEWDFVQNINSRAPFPICSRGCSKYEGEKRWGHCQYFFDLGNKRRA